LRLRQQGIDAFDRIGGEGGCHLLIFADFKPPPINDR
jgi:hypothetical protein